MNPAQHSISKPDGLRFSPRTSLRAGLANFFANDESINGNSGFSSNTAHTKTHWITELRLTAISLILIPRLFN